jgi:hypothetical protein
MAAPRTLDRRRILTLLLRMVVGAALPVVAYLLVRPHVADDLVALVVGAAIPIVYTLVAALWQRRLDPVGILTVCGFCIGLTLAIVTGDNEFVFKIRHDLVAGPLGLACLVSVAVHRPLALVALRLAARRNAEIAERLRNPVTVRIATVSTAVVGTLMLAHALALIVLALCTTTTTFLVVSRPVSWAISVSGVVPLLWWVRRQVRTPGDPDGQPRA